MGRNSRQHQRKETSSSSQHNDLLNFRFSTPAVARQENGGGSSNSTHPSRPTSQDRTRSNLDNRNRRGNNNTNHRGHHHHGNSRRSAQDRASARRKADSSMFYLHSSAEHSFVLSRRSPSKVHQERYSFNGVDESVSWDSVRMVEQRVSLQFANKRNAIAVVAANRVHDEKDSAPACPICLCDFVCSRITKCGHSFCLSCILRHVQTYTANNPYHHVKCPCCGIPIVMNELRPVSFSLVVPPSLQAKLRLRKLHRHKNCAAPFLPVPDAPMHSSPHFAPTAGVDADANYSRFQFVHPDRYHAFLVENQCQLHREIESTLDETEKVYLSMALEMVLAQQQSALEEQRQEEALRERFANPSAGMYQPQSPALVFCNEGANQLQSVVQEETLVELEVGHAAAAAATCASQNTNTPVSMQGRHRGDSMCSYKSGESGMTYSSHHSEEDCITSTSPGGSKHDRHRKKERPIHCGRMYLDGSDSVHFFQSEDGQLVFLNGFNMTCLLSDYSKNHPAAAIADDVGCAKEYGSTSVRPPLPDFVEGQVLEMESICLTSDVRKRMPFLSHIPLFTDVTFVELDLNHLLSQTTREKFKADIAKRRKRRQSKVQAEKRADKQVLREEIEQVKERKARLQRIDPNDDFFQMASLPDERTTDVSEDFGPRLATGNEHLEAHSSTRSSGNSEHTFSFSAALRRGNDPISISSSEAFPALGSLAETLPSPVIPSAPPTVEKSTAKQSLVSSADAAGLAVGKKKKKGPKVVLFSTGGSRGF